MVVINGFSSGSPPACSQLRPKRRVAPTNCQHSELDPHFLPTRPNTSLSPSLNKIYALWVFRSQGLRKVVEVPHPHCLIFSTAEAEIVKGSFDIVGPGTMGLS